jgi:hypothetical protein
MRTFNIIAFVLVLAAAYAVSSCVKRSQDAQKDRDPVANVDAYNIARDSEHDLDARLEAASHLIQNQKKQLQTELLKEVPGELDGKTLDAIWLLAKVGDMAAVERLKQFKQHAPYDIPDKINTAIVSAITEIRKRESKTNP